MEPSPNNPLLTQSARPPSTKAGTKIDRFHQSYHTSSRFCQSKDSQLPLDSSSKRRYYTDPLPHFQPNTIQVQHTPETTVFSPLLPGELIVLELVNVIYVPMNPRYASLFIKLLWCFASLRLCDGSFLTSFL